MSDKTELPKEDLNLIAQIDARLKRLEDIYFSKGEEPKQPIEQVEEVEYVEIVYNTAHKLNLASNYGTVCMIDKNGEQLNECYALIYPDGHKGNAFKNCCKPSTKSAYLSQQEQPKSIVKEEVKERFSVEVIERYFAIGDHTITISFNNDEKLGITEANEIADKIKALLATF